MGRQGLEASRLWESSLGFPVAQLASRLLVSVCLENRRTATAAPRAMSEERSLILTTAVMGGPFFCTADCAEDCNLNGILA